MKKGRESILMRAREVWGEPFLGFTVYDVLHAKGSPLEALLYAALFWPKFVEVAGMVFLPFVVEDESDEERVLKRLESLGDPSLLEEEFNHVEVAALFGRRRGETSVDDDALLAQCLVDMWAAKLRTDYPSRRFCVRVIRPEGEIEVAATLYEER